MLLITEADVRRLLPMPDCIAQMRRVFESLAAGGARNQPRRRLFTPEGSVLHQMAGYWDRYFGTKIYSVNVKQGKAYFTFLLYDSATAEPLAQFEANYLGQIRTGAVTGLATQLMAPENAGNVGLIGSGFQAWSQLEAVLCARPGAKVRVYSRKQEKREDFARRATAAFGHEVAAVDSAEAAVRGADIVTTMTFSKDPVFDDAWLAPGAHVNAAGSNAGDRREVPAATVLRASAIAVDDLDQAATEAGDLLLAAPKDEWTRLPLTPLQDLLTGYERRPGSVTLFKSLGLAVEDVAAAALVYERYSCKPA